MDTIKVNKTRTKMIAHRGLSGIECENTNAAFVAAANRSYYGIETDIHVTTDGRFVIIHDDETARVSEVEINVDKSAFDEVKNIRLKDPRMHEEENGVLRRDLVIPTLEEYLSICKKYGKVAVIELKGSMGGHIERLLETVDNLLGLERAVFISFNWDNCACIKKLLPKQKVQFLCKKCDSELIGKLVNNGIDIDICYPAINEELVKELHTNGIEVNCWTVDTADTAERLMQCGVDYITSNIME